MSDILSSIARYDSQELCDILEVNSDAEIKLVELENNIKYIKIRNFLVRPEAARDFLTGFPAEDRTKSILNGNADKLCTDSTAPGFQQPIPHLFFSNNLSPVYFNVLKYSQFSVFIVILCVFIIYVFFLLVFCGHFCFF